MSGKSYLLSLGFLLPGLGRKRRPLGAISPVRFDLAAVWQQRQELAPLFVICGQWGHSAGGLGAKCNLSVLHVDPENELNSLGQWEAVLEHWKYFPFWELSSALRAM